MPLCFTQEVTCLAPTSIEYLGHKTKGFTSALFWVVPLDDLHSRIIHHAVSNVPVPRFLSWLAARRPRWLDHLLINEIFDGDMCYLRHASVLAKHRDPSGSSWPQDYFVVSQVGVASSHMSCECA